MNFYEKTVGSINAAKYNLFYLFGMMLLAGCREAPEKQASAVKLAPSGISSSSLPPEVVERSIANSVLADPPAGPNSEAPNLFVSSGSVLASWIETIDGHPSIRWARFAAGKWSPATTVISSDDLLVNWADVPAIAEAGSSIWVAFPERNRNREGYRAALVMSEDGGKSFTRRGALHSDGSDSEHGFVAFTPEDKNTIRAFWLDGRATLPAPGKTNASLAMGLYSAVVGASVTQELLLDERTCDCCNLAVGTSDRGTIVAYRDRDEKEVRDISVIYKDGTAFSKPAPVHEDTYRIAGCPVNGPALATIDTRVALAWYTYAQEEPRVKMAFSSDAGAHFGRAVTITESNGSVAPLGRVAVAWADNDDAIVAYVESEREKARIVVRRVHSDGRAFAPVVVAETRPDRKSGFPKIVSFDKLLLVVWTDGESPSRVRAKTLQWDALPRIVEPSTVDGNRASIEVREGQEFPAFDVRTPAGQTISTSSLRGKPALVNIWASYCEPCRQEIPNLSKIHQKYARKGLQVVGLTMDEHLAGDALDKLAKKRAIEYPLWQDPEDKTGKVLGVHVLPVTFLMDERGKIVFVRRGAIQESDVGLEKAIQGLF